MSDQALYADDIGDGLDGFMDFEELKAQLCGLLEFPTDLPRTIAGRNCDPEMQGKLALPDVRFVDGRARHAPR